MIGESQDYKSGGNSFLEEEMKRWKEKTDSQAYQRWLHDMNQLFKNSSGLTFYSEKEYVSHQLFLKHMGRLKILLDVNINERSDEYKKCKTKFLDWIGFDEDTNHFNNELSLDDPNIRRKRSPDPVIKNKMKYINPKLDKKLSKNAEQAIRISRRILLKKKKDPNPIIFGKNFAKLLHIHLCFPCIGDINGAFLLEFYFDYIIGEIYGAKENEKNGIPINNRSIYLCNRSEYDLYSQKTFIIEYCTSAYYHTWRNSKNNENISQKDKFKKLKDIYQEIQQRHEKTGLKGGKIIAPIDKLLNEIGLDSQNYEKSKGILKRVTNTTEKDVLCDLFDYIMDEWQIHKKSGKKENIVKEKGDNIYQIIRNLKISTLEEPVKLNGRRETENYYRMLCFQNELKRYNLKNFVFYDQYLELIIGSLVAFSLNHSMGSNLIEIIIEYFYENKRRIKMQIQDGLIAKQIEENSRNLSVIFPSRSGSKEDVPHPNRELFQDIIYALMIKIVSETKTNYLRGHWQDLKVHICNDEQISAYWDLCELPENWNSDMTIESCCALMLRHKEKINLILEDKLTDSELIKYCRRAIKFNRRIRDNCFKQESAKVISLRILIPIMLLIIGSTTLKGDGERQAVRPKWLCHEIFPTNERDLFDKSLYIQMLLCSGMTKSAKAFRNYMTKAVPAFQRALLSAKNMDQILIVCGEIHEKWKEQMGFLFFYWRILAPIKNKF